MISTTRRASGLLALKAADAILWTLLYALLESNKKYFFRLILLFLSLHIPGVVLNAVGDLTETNNLAVPRSQLDTELGYPCTWDFQRDIPETANVNPGLLEIVDAYITLARTVGVFIWTAHVFVKRFQLKRPSGNLSRVLMNEGGLYYLSSAAVALILAVITRPNSRRADSYQILPCLQSITVLLADRLLLGLRRSQDPGTQKTLSGLVFNFDNRQSEESDVEDS